jgi:hypothetical protein
MPDLNKFQKLRSVGYQIRGCCSLCVHGNFGGDGRPNMTKQGYPGYGWGSCGLHTYQHAKHTAVRGTSIHHSGWCPSFELADMIRATLGSFTEFMG